METNLAAGGHLDTYEFEGPDRAEFVQDLAEFQLAAVRSRQLTLSPQTVRATDALTTTRHGQVLYNGLLENNCSEQASRMAAMESSTKNAKEMLGKLTLSYNRLVPCLCGLVLQSCQWDATCL